ncbi:hypothetical protein IEQ34_016017 [Dendrobium chrysotoxum]|uniref:Uncharacterized protein n=1 Tax=Dendrobium chrysotoxum TaxID=161865 RepID=A0AAV7GEB1_DENCH|nr:hypothetical protein IEQ34_016017 [Dendrobium chrysotoxum]
MVPSINLPILPSPKNGVNDLAIDADDELFDSQSVCAASHFGDQWEEGEIHLECEQNFTNNLDKLDKRFPSDNGAFADWVASSASARGDDLCLGFNAGGGAASASGGGGAGFWAPSSSAAGRQTLNYGVAEMVGLRDVYVVGPATSFHPAAVAAHHEPFHSSAEAHSVIPVLTAAPYLVDDDYSRSSKIQLWQSQQLITSPQPPAPPQNPNPSSTTSYLQKPSSVLESSGILFVAGGPSTCQDCGNQAKKDCSHRRCRTCCKSRGFDCSTHIKSTWVSAARRRERHLTASESANAASSPPTSVLKKPHPSFRENLPGHVRAPAVFKCVRVTSIDDGEDEYAYHAKVNIGGHVFKGFLYNQGFDEGISTDLAGTSTAVDIDNNVNNASNAIPNFSELQLGGGGVRNVPHSDIYGLGGLLGGAAFGNAIN